MEKNTIEVFATLVVNYQRGYEYHIEECHGVQNLSGYTQEITSVKVCIKDELIDITKMLTRTMEDYLHKEINDIHNDL